MEEAPELRLVSVRWRGKDDVERVDVSHFPLTLRPSGPGQYVGDSVAYGEVDGRVGQLAIAAPEGSAAPTLEVSGEAVELYPVRDRSSRTWWIEKGKWDKQKGYHAAPLVNRTGTARFHVGDAEVSVQIAPSGLSRAEFEVMLSEFRNGLWSLILDRQSGATASRLRSAGGVREAFREAAHDLIVSAERALRSPHAELREVVKWQRPDKARPSAQTFQEVARRGAPRLVPGRGHAPSYNTAENRALMAMVERTARLVEASGRAARGRADDFATRAGNTDRRLEPLRERPHEVWVPVDRLRRDLEDVEARTQSWDDAMERTTAGSEAEPGARQLRKSVWLQVASNKRGSPYSLTENGTAVDTFVQERDGAGFRSATREGRYILVRLQLGVTPDEARLVFSSLEGRPFLFDGVVQVVGERYQTGKMERYTLLVIQMGSLDNPSAGELAGLKRALALAAQGDGRGYWRDLRPREREDRRRERASYEADNERYREGARAWGELAGELDGLAKRLRKILDRCDDLGIRPRRGAGERALSSMVFVHNAHYRGVLAAYRRALAAAGLEASEVDRLFELDDVGLLDLPTVYERWCLVQIVRMLEEDFAFDLSSSSSIIEALTAVRGRKTVAVTFESGGYGRVVELAYQPEIVTSKGNRQPDFILTLRTMLGKEVEEVDRDEDYRSHSWRRVETSAVSERKLVLDAKFKPFSPFYGLGAGGAFRLPQEINGLLEKGYGQEGRNRVFVLHPGEGTVELDDVERFCALGGEPVEAIPDQRLDWDQERDERDGRLDHNVGAVLLRPGVRDPLRRLILMHLFEGLKDTEDDKLGDPVLPVFCPACGSDEHESQRHETYLRVDYRCLNVECGHRWIRTYCARCKRHLWKFGPQWNYHATRPLDAYDIKCPNCSTYRPLIEAEDAGEDVDIDENPFEA